jgi:branched-chain amino acid transport system permease protein
MSLAYQQFFLFCVIYILLGWGLYLPYKAGQFTWAAAFCMSGGGYFAAYASTVWHWPFGVCMLASMIVGAVLAFIPALGLRTAPTFATVVASLAVIFILQSTYRNWRAVGGAAGMFGIPRPHALLPVAFALLVVIGVIINRLDRSRLGRAADALFVNRDVAGSLGVSMGATSVAFQSAAGAIGALAGGLYAFGVGTVFPDAFGANLLVIGCAPLFVGGTSTLWGVVLMVPILWGVPLAVPGYIAQWKDIIIGVVLIAVLLVRPEGLITRATLRAVEGSFDRFWKFVARPRKEDATGLS